MLHAAAWLVPGHLKTYFIWENAFFFFFFFFEEGKSTRAVLLVHVVSRLLSLMARRQRACSGVPGAVAQGMRSDHVGIINALTNRFHIFGSGFHSFGVTV